MHLKGDILFRNIFKRIFNLIIKPVWSTNEVLRLIYLHYSNIWFEDKFGFLKIERSSFKPQTDDLRRIWDNISKSKPKVCLEYGSGISSVVILDAMSTYKSKSKLISIESTKKWANNTRKMILNSDVKGNFDLRILNPVVENVILKLYNSSPKFWYPSKINSSRGNFICLKYEYIIKNFIPDFIYIDGPDPNSSKGFKSSNKKTLIPCVIDILYIEENLRIGSLILIDGRDFNASILWSNFKRKWERQIFNNQGMTLFKLIQ